MKIINRVNSRIFLQIWNIREFTLTMIFMIFSPIATSELLLKITEIIFRVNFGIISTQTEIQEFSLSMISVIFCYNGKLRLKNQKWKFLGIHPSFRTISWCRIIADGLRTVEMIRDGRMIRGGRTGIIRMVIIFCRGEIMFMKKIGAFIFFNRYLNELLN